MFFSTLLLLFSSLPSILGQRCTAAGWTDSDRNEILNSHNNLRSQLARGSYVAKGVRKSSATDMLKMFYDCSLEASAQNWANTCRKVHSGISGKGENLYWKWSTVPIAVQGEGLRASNNWANEFQTYGFGTSNNNNMRSLDFSVLGHATQMAWASTNRVGCGVKACPSDQAGFDYMLMVVCHYSPPGNYMDRNVYTAGPACSACPSGTHCDSGTKLCVENGETSSVLLQQMNHDGNCQPAAVPIGRKVLKSVHGTFLRAYPGRKVDMALEAKAWEQWHIENHNGKAVFKSSHNPSKFLRSNPNGDIDLADQPKAWEFWTPTRHSDGSWSFKSFHNKWLSANKNGSVTQVKNLKSWEHFQLNAW